MLKTKYIEVPDYSENIGENILNVYRDLCPENPYDFMEHAFIFYSNHRRYTFCKDERRLQEIIDESKHTLKSSFTKQNVWLPVSMYDHSGLTIWVGHPNDEWDSGLFGIIAYPKSNIERDFGPNAEDKALSFLKGVVEEVNDYYQGDVWRYELTDKNGDVCDSCCGFYGSLEEVLPMMKENLPK